MSSSPWWASGLFAVVGGLVTAAVTVALTIANRRTERRRLSRDQKVKAYPALLHAANRLTKLPVWPAQAGDPHELLDDVNRIAQDLRVFAPAARESVTALLAAGETLATTITTIRTQSKPAHGDLIDQREITAHRAAVEELQSAGERVLAIAQVDLEVT